MQRSADAIQRSADAIQRLHERPANGSFDDPAGTTTARSIDEIYGDGRPSFTPSFTKLKKNSKTKNHDVLPLKQPHNKPTIIQTHNTLEPWRRSTVMSAVKQPVAGEWWIFKDSRTKIYIIGTDSCGNAVCQRSKSGDPFLFIGDISEVWHHAPECTGWDWEPLDWTEITDPSHILRSGIDWLYNPHFGKWELVDSSGGQRLVPTPTLRKARCLRRDEPSLPSELSAGDGYRLIDILVDEPMSGDEFWDKAAQAYEPRADHNKTWASFGAYRRKLQSTEPHRERLKLYICRKRDAGPLVVFAPSGIPNSDYYEELKADGSGGFYTESQ